MKKKAFEKLLKEAILLDAEEQGSRLAPEIEPIPTEAQARFDAALNGKDGKPKTTAKVEAGPAKTHASKPAVPRWLIGTLTAAAFAAAVFVAVVLIGAGGMRGTKPSAPADMPPVAAEATDAPAATQEPVATDEPVMPENPAEPGETTPVLSGNLPEVKTVVHPWRGYDCLIPEGFVSAYESDNEFISCRSEMNDRNMFQMAYELVPTETLEGWNSAVFSEQHLLTLLSKIGVPESQYKDFAGHSVRTVENGVVCYHLYNRTQKVFACLATVQVDEKNSLVAAGMTLGEYGIGEFDSVVNALVQHYAAEATNAPAETQEPFATDEPVMPEEPVAPEDPAELLIGTWDLKAMESREESQSAQIAIVNAMIAAGKYEATYTFLSDGNGLSYWNREGQKTAQVFAYVIDGDKLTFSSETMAFAIEGDRLSLTEAGMTLLFDRSDPSTSEGTELSKLRMKSQTWQGYSCLFPETFRIQEVTDLRASATEGALLDLDLVALQTTGLTDMDYYLVADSMRNGKDLLAWYLEADAWEDKPEDFDTAETVEIVPGIESVHYYNRIYDSYICIAKVNRIGTNTMFVAASSMTKAGTADFDSIVKWFVMLNGDFSQNAAGVENSKYGKSKVFSEDRYRITLTEQFSEANSEKGFDGYYTSYFGAVMVKIEPFTLSATLSAKTTEEYIRGVIQNNRVDAKPETKNGHVFYRYHRSGMSGWNFAFKGADAFYLVQFLCREADEPELEDLAFFIADSFLTDAVDLVGTWVMIDPPSSAEGYTFELVFQSDETVRLNVSQGEQAGGMDFTYTFIDNTVHLFMNSYGVYPDGSIDNEKEEMYLFVSDGVITYDPQTDRLTVPNEDGGQTQFIRAE